MDRLSEKERAVLEEELTRVPNHTDLLQNCTYLWVDLIFDEIQQEMRSQYALAYTPLNTTRDGGFRKIEIKPKNKDLKAQARKGYFAQATVQ